MVIKDEESNSIQFKPYSYDITNITKKRANLNQNLSDQQKEDEDREEISAKKNDKISVQVKKGYMDCQYWQRDNTFKVLDPIDYLDQKEFDRND